MRAFRTSDRTPIHGGHSGVPTFRLTAAGRAPLYAKRLAAAGMSIGSDELNPQYDAGHVSRFFGRYGADPADSRREFYLRAYEVG